MAEEKARMFRKLDETISVFGQILPEDVAAAAAQGFTTIINNRPDNEEPGQPSGSSIALAAAEAGIAYQAIPVTHAGFTEAMIAEMQTALARAPGPVLAFCRSGTRSTLLWALARSRAGDDAAGLEAKARAAGYDLTPVRGMM
jgi:uncharacterized protein (TIGR01244 family)